jgi:hypothetical protein
MVEWTKMFLDRISTNSRSVLAIDHSLVNLFGNPSLPWPDVFDYLSDRYRSLCRILSDGSEGGRKHYIFVNPRNSDYFLQFILWKVNVFGLPERVYHEPSEHHQGDNDIVRTRPHRSNSASSYRGRIPSIDPLHARLLELQNLGVRLAQPGEYQIDVFAVSREGVADEVEYGHINEIVNAVCFWLWDMSL